MRKMMGRVDEVKRIRGLKKLSKEGGRKDAMEEIRRVGERKMNKGLERRRGGRKDAMEKDKGDCMREKEDYGARKTRQEGGKVWRK